MADFCIALLDLCLVPFQHTDNILVFAPTAFLTISFLFLVVRLLVRGEYR